MKAAVCKEPGKPLEFEDISLRKLEDDEVLIKVHYCGICHSDIHIIDGHWADRVKYPVIPGHEVVGIVVDKGKNVRNIEVGDRVGVPWVYSSCGICDYCLEGEEQFCPEYKITGISVPGGYAEYMISKGSFTTKIPKDLNMEEAAPLFCAGLTVYSALKRVNLRPGEKVAVHSIGGLGHLAIQYAKGMGAYVFAISSTKEKERLAKELGADVFVWEGDDVVDILRSFGGMDVIITTSFISSSIEKLIKCLAPRGRLTFVGNAMEPIKIYPREILGKRLVITGSAVGNRKLLRETLEYAVKWNIRPKIEIHPFDKINEGLEKVRRGKANMRVVLDISSSTL